MSPDEKAAKLAKLRAYLDKLDEQTREPGEPPLRLAVAEEARANLRAMGPRDHKG